MMFCPTAKGSKTYSQNLFWQPNFGSFNSTKWSVSGCKAYPDQWCWECFVRQTCLWEMVSYPGQPFTNYYYL